MRIIKKREKTEITEITDIIKKIGIQEWVLIAIILILCFMQFSTLTKLKQMPGPVYGGDVYYHFGHVNHIVESGSIFQSSHFIEEYEHYPWLSHLTAASISWISGASALRAAAVYYPVFLTALTLIILYFLCLKTYKNKNLAVVFSVLWAVQLIPNVAPSIAAKYTVIPLFVLGIYFANQNIKSRVFAGVIFGLTGIQHITVFLGACLFIFLMFLKNILSEHINFSEGKLRIKNTKNILLTIKKEIIFFLPIIIIGILIAMLFWWPLMFVYQGKTLNPWQEYTGIGVESATIGAAFNRVIKLFTNFNSLIAGVLSVLALVGLVTGFKIKNKALKEIPWLLLVTGFIGLVHPIITVPLIGTSFGHYRFPLFFTLAKYMFAFGGLFFIYELIKKSSPEQSRKSYLNAFIITVLIFSFFSFSTTINAFKNNQWTKNGFQLSADMAGMQNIAEWIKENTAQQDVFLTTHGETGFALNSLTGRKVAIMRRTHANPFVDVNKRIADAAVILYGNNAELRQELLKKYNIKYLYYDLYSSKAQLECRAAWDKISQPEYGDASYPCLRTSFEYEDYLKQNGVTTQRVNARLDPARAEAPRFDIIAINASEPKLELEKIKDITIQGVLISEVNRIK
ncbi:hypothetical protein ACFL0W_00075 [Nanoarchaeota archaeon]